MLIQRYVVVRSVLDTEDTKQKHGVEKRASDGMFKHLIIIVTRQIIHFTCHINHFQLHFVKYTILFF